MLLKNIMDIIQYRKHPGFIKSSSYQLYFETLSELSNIKFFYYCLYKNKFLKEKDKNILMSIYIDSKKILNIMDRFVKNIKFKLYKKYENDVDLRFIPLKNYDKTEIINIIQNKTVYSFRILDLINLWKISLYTNENMFPRPKQLKNPFTNLIFQNYNLYNIFISFSKTNFIIPDCILQYYKCNFDMRNFKCEFFPKLQSNAIKYYTKNGAISEHHDYIVSMLHDFRKSTNYIFIENRISIFKKMKIVDLLRDILCFYLKQKFLCNTLLKEKYERLVKSKLKSFFNENKSLPYFYTLSESEILRYEGNDLLERAEDFINVLDTINQEDDENTTVAETGSLETLNNSYNTNERNPTRSPLISSNITNTFRSNRVYRRRRNSIFLPPIVENSYITNVNPFRPSRELSRSPRNSIIDRLSNSSNTSIINNRRSNITRGGINITSNINGRLSFGL